DHERESSAVRGKLRDRRLAVFRLDDLVPFCSQDSANDASEGWLVFRDEDPDGRCGGATLLWCSVLALGTFLSRKVDRHDRAVSHLTLDPHRPGVTFDDSVRDSQPKPAPLALRREEGIEHATSRRLIDSRAVVVNCECDDALALGDTAGRRAAAA